MEHRFFTDQNLDEPFRKWLEILRDNFWIPEEVSRNNPVNVVVKRDLYELIVETTALLNAFDMAALHYHGFMLSLPEYNPSGNLACCIAKMMDQEVTHVLSYSEILAGHGVDIETRNQMLRESLDGTKHRAVLDFIENKEHIWMRMIVWEYVIFPMFFSRFLRLSDPGLVLVNEMLALILKDEEVHSAIQRTQFNICRKKLDYDPKEVLTRMHKDVKIILEDEGFNTYADAEFIDHRFNILLGNRGSRHSTIQEVLSRWITSTKANPMELMGSGYAGVR